MVKTVHCHVTTSALVVTTITVSVIKGVNRAGRETTVKNVMYFNYTTMSFPSEMKHTSYLNEYFIT